MPMKRYAQNSGITFQPFGGGGNTASRGDAYQTYQSQYRVPQGPQATGSVYGHNTGGIQASDDWWRYNYNNQQANQEGQANFTQGINERNMALQHKYGMEMLNAQLAGQQQSQWNQMLAMGIDMPTNEQINTARGRYDRSQANYQGLSENGAYSDEEEAGLITDAGNQIEGATRAMQQGTNDYAASLGMAQNPNAIYYMGNAGQYQAAGERGRVKADLAREEAINRQRGYEGEFNVADRYAGLDVTPTKENAFIGIYGPNGEQMGQDPNGPLPYGGDAQRPKKRRY